MIAKSRQSTFELMRLLEEVIRSPADFQDDPITHHLNSQGLLCRYSSLSRGVAATSLNTLKRNSTHLPGGFQKLDQLRLEASRRMQIISKTGKESGGDSRRALKLIIQTRDNELQTAHEDLLLLTRLLDISLRQARNYALESGNGSIQKNCSREQSELIDFLTLRKTESKSLKLVPKS